MKKLFSISSKGEHYTADLIDNEDGSGQFVGDMDIDIDGSPDWERDPYGQPDTTLHFQGKPINGQKVPFFVLPPEIILAFKGILLGCHGTLHYRGNTIDAVCADVGPHNKLGEASPEAARRLGINDDPNHGGEDEQRILYRFWPGRPAFVDNITYDLQSYG